LGLPAERESQLVATVSERQPGIDRYAETCPGVRDRRRQIVSVVVRRGLEAVEAAEEDRALPREHAGEMQLVEHSLDPVRMLADVFEHQDTAGYRRKMRASDQMGDHRQVAAPERPARGEFGGTLQRQFDVVARTGEQ